MSRPSEPAMLPRVALETTIFSHLGLPSPANAEALERCVAAIEAAGAEAAVTCVLDGVPRVGIARDEWPRVLGPGRKASERDLEVAIAQRWAFGATTVSSSLLLAARAGIRVFATGGIGGVHRGAERHGDVSSDLTALAAHPVVTVCAGAKSFLDLPRTLEWLETLGVTVVGLGCDEFPAFTVRSSGLPIPTRADSVEEVAALVRAHASLGRRGGILVCVPIPEADALPRRETEAVIERALADADARGIVGGAVTPHVLAAIAVATGGASVRANVALAAHNASVAARLAVLLHG
ncbi:MAG: pseudouridine-5'-phosphate glycosidase [Ilumatobacteraceae bacterium]